MAPGVQFSAPYTFIGGPRETGNRRTNLVWNTRAAIDLTGINSVSAQVVITRVSDEGPLDSLTSVKSVGTNMPGSSSQGYVASGRSGGASGLDGTPVVAGQRYAVRILSAITELSLGTIDNFRARIYWYQASGASSAITNNVIFDNQGIPTMGQVVAFDGVVDAPADAAFARLLVNVSGTVTISLVAYTAGFMITPVEAAISTAPVFFDGDTPGYYWKGDAHKSDSGQDGTRAVLNTEADPDFVGYATEVTGLAGAEVRESSIDNIEADGAIHGEFYQGRRPVTVTAYIGGNVTPPTRNARMQRWQAATRALRRRGAVHREGTMSWRPDGMTEDIYLRFRRQQAPTPTGFYGKEVPVGLIAADPRIYSMMPENWKLVGSGSSAAGRTYDRSYDVNYDWAPSRGIIQPTNIGDADAPVLITIVAVTGTSATLAVQNETTEEEISLNGSLLVGESLIIDTYTKTVTHYTAAGTPSNAFDRVELPRTRWWGLAPGVNQINLLAGTMGADLRMLIDWRHAWA